MSIYRRYVSANALESVPGETGRDRVADLLNACADDGVTSLETMKRVGRLCDHLDAQAARIATLEAENERLKARVTTLDRIASEAEALLNEWCEGVDYYGGVDDFIAFRLRPALDAHPTQTEDETDGQ